MPQDDVSPLNQPTNQPDRTNMNQLPPNPSSLPQPSRTNYPEQTPPTEPPAVQGLPSQSFSEPSPTPQKQEVSPQPAEVQPTQVPSGPSSSPENLEPQSGGVAPSVSQLPTPEMEPEDPFAPLDQGSQENSNLSSSPTPTSKEPASSFGSSQDTASNQIQSASATTPSASPQSQEVPPPASSFPSEPTPTNSSPQPGSSSDLGSEAVRLEEQLQPPAPQQGQSGQVEAQKNSSMPSGSSPLPAQTSPSLPPAPAENPDSSPGQSEVEVPITRDSTQPPQSEENPPG